MVIKHSLVGSPHLVKPVKVPFFGGLVSGVVIDKFYTHEGVRDWHSIWLAFAGYALAIGIAFAIFFKHKHNPDEVADLSH